MTSGVSGTINSSFGGDSQIQYPLLIIGSLSGRVHQEYDGTSGVAHTYTITADDAAAGGPIIWAATGLMYGNWSGQGGEIGMDASMSLVHTTSADVTIKNSTIFSLQSPTPAELIPYYGWGAGGYIDGPFTAGEKLKVVLYGWSYWFSSTGVIWDVYTSNFFRKNNTLSPTRISGKVGSAYYN